MIELQTGGDNGFTMLELLFPIIFPGITALVLLFVSPNLPEKLGA